jgi:division protein CdvB (Snf7/Vps24/ESCRT-III family)
MAAIFSQVTGEKIRVTEGGATRTITKFEALVRQLVAKGLSGDMRAIREIFTLKRLIEATSDDPMTLETHENDLEMMREIMEMIENANLTTQNGATAE